jgi:hypothetical protein
VRHFHHIFAQPIEIRGLWPNRPKLNPYFHDNFLPFAAFKTA